MLIGDMDISRLVVHAKKNEEVKLKEERSRYNMRSRMDDDKSLHDESDGLSHPRYRQQFLGQGPSNTRKFNQKGLPNPKTQGDSSRVVLPGCSKCDRRHEGECLAGSNICFGCGELGHKIRHFPKVARNEGDSHRKSQPYSSSGPIGLGGSAQNKNRP